MLNRRNRRVLAAEFMKQAESGMFIVHGSGMIECPCRRYMPGRMRQPQNRNLIAWISAAQKETQAGGGPAWVPSESGVRDKVSAAVGLVLRATRAGEG